MKFSIAASFLILAIGAGLGWRDRQQLAAMRADHRQLSATVSRLGPSPDVGGNPKRPAKRERPARSSAKKLSSAELLELAKGTDLLRLYDSLSALDPAGLKALLAEIATNPELDESTRLALLSSCSAVLANDHPLAALDIFTSSPELFKAGDEGRSLVLTALSCLAKNNLPAALGWLRNHPHSYASEAKGEIIKSVAKDDPRLAFRLIKELDFKITNYEIGQMLGSPKMLDEKSAALAGLREFLATIPDEHLRESSAASSLSCLAISLRDEGFDSATRWIAGERLSPKEFSHVAAGLDISTTNGETGRWIEWLRQTVPGEATDQQITTLIHQWTASDYQAAMKWAATQPPGKDRDQVFKSIHATWPQEDPAGKKAFANEHGIK